MKVTVAQPLESLSRVHPATRTPIRIGLVQTCWHEAAAEHESVLAEGIEAAASNGAKIVFLPELTLSRYMADTEPAERPNLLAETLQNGPTHRFAAKAAAALLKQAASLSSALQDTQRKARLSIAAANQSQKRDCAAL